METIMVLAPMFVFLVGWFVIGRLIPLAFKDEDEKNEESDSTADAQPGTVIKNNESEQER